MAEMLTVAQLTAATAMPERVVEIPGKGSVRVRALTRGEVLRFEQATNNNAYAERKAIAAALVEPRMTEDEVKAWQNRSVAGDIKVVANAIAELSGLSGRPDKEAYKSFRDEPDAGVRLLPGAEVGDERGPDEGGTE